MLPVVISTANFGYLDFVRNLLKTVQDVLKNHRFVMYCMDRELFDAIQEYASERIEIVLYDCNVPKTFMDYASTGAFSSMMYVKMELIRSALQKYGYIHFVDGDVVFCKEPTEEYYSAYAEYDIVYQRDLPPPHEP
jgi:lipopolysaccharide biosynthesis glycosyltransferase